MTLWPWISLIALGAWHGVNPAMGWLFAVSRGLQERRGSATFGALAPIALGHALALGLAFAVLAVGAVSLPGRQLRWATAALLIGFGAARVVRHRHPRWVGMRVGFGGLTWWSFLMATAHGAGLMLLPLFVVAADQPACHARAGLSLASGVSYVSATLVHTAAMIAVTGAIALVVYYKVGLALLRHAWFDLDWLWSLALVISGAFALIG